MGVLGWVEKQVIRIHLRKETSRAFAADRIRVTIKIGI
jgi:hypothetical protein